jgi:hypothetical protein
LVTCFVRFIGHLVGSSQINLYPYGGTLAGLAVSKRVDIKRSSGDELLSEVLITSCCGAFFCAGGSYLCDLPPQHAQGYGVHLFQTLS